MKRILVSSAMALVLGAPVYAQEASSIPVEITQKAPRENPSAPFAGDLEYAGQINGVDTWTVPDEDFVLSRGENGNVYIGYVFDKDGKDLASGLAGFDPLSVEEVIKTAAKGDKKTNAVNLPELEPQPELAENDEDILSKAPEAVRNELLARLIERLDTVKTKEEYAKTVEDWRKEVRTTLAKEKDAVSSEELEGIKNKIEDLIVKENAESVGAIEEEVDHKPEEKAATPQVNNDLLTGSSPAIERLDLSDTNLSMGHESKAVPAEADKDQVVSDNATTTEARRFDVLKNDSNYFATGNQDAPNVYMIVDPTCPYCSRSLVAIKELVDSGKIRLNVIPAALLSERSQDVLAGVMSSSNPSVTLFDNAESKVGTGGKAVEPKNYAELPAEMRAALEKNRQNVINMGVTQIPYFAWEENGEKKGHFGVYEDGLFKGLTGE